jgi:hypothetical protein
MKRSEIKKTEPSTMKSSGTDDPEKYVGEWESYDSPQGIKDRRDPKVLAMENSYGPISPSRFAPEKDMIQIPIGPEETKAIKLSRKAPKAEVRKSAMALSARGKKPVLDPRRKKKKIDITETIRRPITGSLNNEYEIIDDDENTIGFAKVSEGVIETLDYETSATEQYRGHILSAILNQIVTEADHRMANLSIQITEMSSDIKYILERHGFRLAGGSVMKRNAGSLRPTSVCTTAGMSD